MWRCSVTPELITGSDRSDLENQLSGTAALTGESVDIATSADALRHLLRRKGPGLLFGMIQKQRAGDLGNDAVGEPPLQRGDLHKLPSTVLVAREPSPVP